MSPETIGAYAVDEVLSEDAIIRRFAAHDSKNRRVLIDLVGHSVTLKPCAVKLPFPTCRGVRFINGRPA